MNSIEFIRQVCKNCEIFKKCGRVPCDDCKMCNAYGCTCEYVQEVKSKSHKYCIYKIETKK